MLCFSYIYSNARTGIQSIKHFFHVLICFHSKFQSVFRSLKYTFLKTEHLNCNLKHDKEKNSVPVPKTEMLTDTSAFKNAKDNMLVHQNKFLNFTTFSSSPVVSLGLLNHITQYY